MTEILLECRECGDKVVAENDIQYALFFHHHSKPGHGAVSQ